MAVEERRVWAPSVWKMNRPAFMPCQAFFYNRAIPKTIEGLRDFDRVTRVYRQDATVKRTIVK